MRSTESSRFTGLDGLRALAVTTVLIFHADSALLPGGFLGVDLFFAISGYLITRLLLQELRSTGGLDLSRFYLRRVIRLLPALLVVLAAVILGCLTVWRDELPTLRGGVASTLIYSGNWWLIEAHQSYFVASGRPPMTQQLWSLAIEEQFYLIWPVLLVLLTAGLFHVGRRIGRASGPAYPDRWPLPGRFGRLAVLCAILGTASTVAMAVQAVRGDVPYGTDSSRVYFGTDTHAMGLLFGAMFGALAERQALRPRRWRLKRWVTDAFGLAGLITLAGCTLRVDEFSTALYRGGFGIVSLIAALTVATLARRGSRAGALLDRQPLRWLAERSYAIYLWHWPVVVVTRPDVDLALDHRLLLALRIVAPVGLAELSYRLIERPVRRRGAAYLQARERNRPAGRRWVRLPRWVLVAGLIGAFAVLVTLPSGRPADDLRPAAASVRGARGAQSDPVRTATAGTPVAPPPTSSAGAGATVRARHSTGRAGATPATRAAATPGPRPAPTPAARPVVSAYGDSVMLGAQNALALVFAGCDLHAVEGRQPYVTLAEVRADHDAGHQQATVVIHTGNNGVIRPSDLSDTLLDLRDRHRVVLLTDRVPMDWQGPNNATIGRVAKQFPNVVVLDWYARSNGDQSWFYADGLHLRPDGAGHYADLVLAAAR